MRSFLLGITFNMTEERKPSKKSIGNAPLGFVDCKGMQEHITMMKRELSKAIADYAMLRPSFPNLINQSPNSKQLNNMKTLNSRNSSQNVSQT